MRTNIDVSNFGGMAPRVGPRALGNGQAQLASNARLTSGELEALNEPLQVATLLGLPGPAVSAIKSVITDSFRWLAWHVVVDAVRSVVAGDRSGLVYYTGDGPPRWTTYALAGRDGYPINSMTLGVPEPTAAPTVTFTGATGDVVSRAIRYSLVLPSADGWEQESQASPPTIGTGAQGGTWQISGLPQPPVNSYAITSVSWAAGVLTVNTSTNLYGLRAGDLVRHATLGDATVATVGSGLFTIAVATNPGALTGPFSRVAPHDVAQAKWRIYWSEEDGSYKQVGDYPVATPQPISIVATTIGTAVEPLTDAPMPPVDLKSLARHTSGALVGISGNQLCCSNPYQPYAWPLRFRTPVPYDPVACRVFGRSIVVGTEGPPAIYTGSDPFTLGPEDVTVNWPCLSARGMVTPQSGVAYPSPYGLVWVDERGPQLVTEASYARKDWELLRPHSFIAAAHGTSYVSLYETDNSQELWVFQPTETAPISVATGEGVTGMTVDPQTGDLVLLIGDKVFAWDADPGRRREFAWRSKEFTLSPPGSVGAVWVVADNSMTPAQVSAAQAAQQQDLNANLLITDGKGALARTYVGRLPIAGSLRRLVGDALYDKLTLNAYVDGEVVYSQPIQTGIHKFPAVGREDNVTFELIGNVRVRSLLAAGSSTDLLARPKE